jgi:NET1-associated nuclear protein 1 (U3 small nucleolar RNA-associated protein 17)
MDVDEDQAGEEEERSEAVVVKPMSSSRTVTASEMNDLVGLFRKHGIQGKP